jgi:hypothetical protein
LTISKNGFVVPLEPMDQEIWRRLVPGEGNVLFLLMLPGQPVNGKIRSTEANAVDLAMEPALQGVTGLVEHKLDAGRAGIENQNEWISRIHGLYLSGRGCPYLSWLPEGGLTLYPWGLQVVPAGRWVEGVPCGSGGSRSPQAFNALANGLQIPFQRLRHGGLCASDGPST